MTKENIVKTLFKRKYPDEKVFYNYRPDWLVNIKTGKNLELDIYYPELKLAIEVQGIHHETEYQIFKDNIKKEKCEELGITLETISIHNKSIKKIINKYQLNPKGIRIKRFGCGTPRKGSKIGIYYDKITKQIRREKKASHYKQIKEIQDKEREFNKRLGELRQGVSVTSSFTPIG